jgi:aspartate carbamoyltransferase catalytic subunit
VQASRRLIDAAHVTDVLYVTRVQSERLPADHPPPPPLVVDDSILAALPATSVIMHPLPRQAEVPDRVDRDARAIYFEQARNGVPVRMAVLNHLLSSSL